MIAFNVGMRSMISKARPRYSLVLGSWGLILVNTIAWTGRITTASFFVKRICSDQTQCPEYLSNAVFRLLIKLATIDSYNAT